MGEAETLRRAFLPEVLLPADVAIALQVEEKAAREMLLAGILGKPFNVGGTVVLLRSEFLAALKRRGRAPRPEVIV